MKQNHVDDVEKIITSHKTISNDFAKKILIWFFRQSENFTKPIAVSVYTQDPDKFQLFDEINTIFSKVNSDIMFSFFKSRCINRHFDCRGGIFLCQGDLVGFVRVVVPTKGFRQKNCSVVTHRLINREACTLSLSPWENGILACEFLQLNLEEVEAIAL